MNKQVIYIILLLFSFQNLNAQGYFNFKMADAYNHKEVHFTQIASSYKNFNPNLPTILITWSAESANSNSFDMINRYNLVALNKVNLLTLNIDQHSNNSKYKTKERLIEQVQAITKTWKNSFHFYANIEGKEKFSNLFSTSKTPLILVFHPNKSLLIAYDNKNFFPYQFGLSDVQSIINIPNFFTESPEDLTDLALSIGEDKYANQQEILKAQEYLARAKQIEQTNNFLAQYYKQPEMDLQTQNVLEFKQLYAQALLMYNSNKKINALKNIRKANLVLEKLNLDRAKFYNFPKNKFSKKVEKFQNKLLDEL